METVNTCHRQGHAPLAWSRLIRYALLMAVPFLLMACSSGGSRPAPPPTPPPTAPPPPPPPPTPPVVEPPDPAFSGHLTTTGADLAHADGLSGAGIRIGVIDSGVNRNHPALSGRIASNLTYIDQGSNDLSVDDVLGHGTAVAQVIAGTAFGRWPGGIAPGAEILSARIIADTPPEDDGSGRGNEVEPGTGGLGLEPIHHDLIQRGMRIMNNSWGGLYWNDPNVTVGIAAEYRDFILNHDGLVVFSTGNSGFEDPSDTAALPSQPGPGGHLPAADLEHGWLAVTALDRDDPSQLAEYANACGIAMYYCLAAPGSVVVTGTDDPPDAPEYWRWTGTSFAAPIVSGAAALVWEAFPYFDNDLITQTLLGTATDLGEPGVDPVFGYGAVDIARAVQGPSRLDWGDLRVSFDGGTSVWGNDLSGDGALIKDGNGTLILEGRLGNRDGLFVDAGTVQALDTIDGMVDVAASAQLVLGDGLRGGDIGQTLDNAGQVDILAYGADVRTTHIGGDYLHRSTASLGLELGQDILVEGAAVIEGGTFHLLGLKPGYTHAARERVLWANAGVNGQFNQMTWESSLFLQGQLGYAPQEVWLDITRLDVTAAALNVAGITPQALSAAARVELAFSGLDAGTAHGLPTDDAFWHGAGQFQRLHDPATARAALDSLSGQAYARALTLALDTIGAGRRAVAAQIATWGGRAPDDSTLDRTWKRVLGRGGAGGMVGGGWSQQGWLIGHERALSGQAAVGFAFGESQARAAFATWHERSHARQTQAHLYLGATGEHHYLAAQLGFGHHQRHTLRHPFTGDRWQGVYSQTRARHAAASVEVGRRFTLNAVTLAPYLGVDHVRLDDGGFQEWGGAGFGLHADAGRVQRTQALAGLRAKGHWYGLELSGYAEWQQVLVADGFAPLASFTGIDSWSPLPLADAARSGGGFGVSARTWLTPRAHLSTSVDQHIGPRGRERMAMVRYVYGF